MSATIASGIVRDMPKVATNGVVQTTHNALERKEIHVEKRKDMHGYTKHQSKKDCFLYQK